MIDTNELRSMVNGAQFEGFASSVIHSLLDRLEAAEKERDDLRAKITEMEQQEPVAEIGQQYTLLFAGSGSITGVVKRHGLKIGAKLYALPGAQPEPNLSDTAIQKQLATQWGYVQKPHPDCDSGCMFQCAQPAPSLASGDVSLISEGKTQPAPSVLEGWPTEEMTTAFARVFNVRDQSGTFTPAFRAALAAAPEAKT